MRGSFVATLTRYLVIDVVDFSGYKILKDRDDHVIVMVSTGRQFLPGTYYYLRSCSLVAYLGVLASLVLSMIVAGLII